MIDYKKKLAEGRDEGRQIPVLMAIILIEGEDIEESLAEDICAALGVSENYSHMVRSLLKVEKELNDMGFEIKPTTQVVTTP